MHDKISRRGEGGVHGRTLHYLFNLGVLFNISDEHLGPFHIGGPKELRAPLLGNRSHPSFDFCPFCAALSALNTRKTDHYWKERGGTGCKKAHLRLPRVCFFRAAGRFGVGHRPKSRAAKLFAPVTIKTWPKPQIAHEKSLAPWVASLRDPSELKSTVTRVTKVKLGP